MRVENRILLIAFFLLLILASSAGHDDGLRGGSRVGEDNNRNAQFPIFPSFFAFLWSLLGRLAGAILSVPTALLQFLLSVLFSFWNFVFGIFVSVPSPFATTTTTLVPTTAMTTLAATTSSTFFSTEMTTGVATSSTEMTNPATSSSAGTAMSTVPTALTSMLLSTSTASTSTSTSSTSTSTMGTTTSVIPLNKTVFLTSIRFTADFGGLEGGDTECNALAQSIGLPGNFFAWLSNATHSPNTRFTRSLGPYVLTNGAKFADNYAALISGGPLESLDIQENMVAARGSSSIRRVWTGTGADGNATINHCNNWQSNSNTFFGTTAEPRSTNSPDWTNVQTVNCDGQRRLYCFEQ